MTLTPQEAAHVLGVSRDFFDEHVRDDLRVLRAGSLATGIVSLVGGPSRFP